MMEIIALHRNDEVLTRTLGDGEDILKLVGLDKRDTNGLGGKASSE